MCQNTCPIFIEVNFPSFLGFTLFYKKIIIMIVCAKCFQENNYQVLQMNKFNIIDMDIDILLIVIYYFGTMRFSCYIANIYNKWQKYLFACTKTYSN